MQTGCKYGMYSLRRTFYPQFMEDEDWQERELGIQFALILLGKCDELWVFATVSVAVWLGKSPRQKAEYLLDILTPDVRRFSDDRLYALYS